MADCIESDNFQGACAQLRQSVRDALIRSKRPGATRVAEKLEIRRAVQRTAARVRCETGTLRSIFADFERGWRVSLAIHDELIFVLDEQKSLDWQPDRQGYTGVSRKT